jgi:hypothetical protein
MKAFASHIPDDGAVLIYYGPHIGITKNGILGEIHRVGQSKNSNCCGAAKGALGKLLKNEIVEDEVTEMDYQMNVLEQILFKQKSRIMDSNLPIAEATEVIYEAIDQRINELVSSTKYNCKYVILVGAILINSDSDMGSYTSTKRFDIINLEDNTRQSVIDEFLSVLK